MIGLIVSIFIAIFSGVIWLGVKGGTGVDRYFYSAVLTWLKYSDENARLAALAAAKVASPNAQEDYKGKLIVISTYLRTAEEANSEQIKNAELLFNLYREISSKNWTVEDAKEERKKLFGAEPEYAQALNKFDPSVFAKRYSNNNLSLGKKEKVHVQLLKSLAGEDKMV